MSFSLDVSTDPLRLQVEGCLTNHDVVAIRERLDALGLSRRRPPVLVDARTATLTSILWNKSSRTGLETMLQRVGPVAVVTANAMLINSVKLALHPFGSDVVWRMFDEDTAALAWLQRIATHGAPIWNPDLPLPAVSEERLNRLLTTVLLRS